MHYSQGESDIGIKIFWMRNKLNTVKGDTFKCLNLSHFPYFFEHLEFTRKIKMQTKRDEIDTVERECQMGGTRQMGVNEERKKCREFSREMKYSEIETSKQFRMWNGMHICVNDARYHGRVFFIWWEYDEKILNQKSKQKASRERTRNCGETVWGGAESSSPLPSQYLKHCGDHRT